jgi:hypothetical protein
MLRLALGRHRHEQASILPVDLEKRRVARLQAGLGGGRIRHDLCHQRTLVILQIDRDGKSNTRGSLRMSRTPFPM